MGVLKRQGMGVRAIGRMLGRAASTISRELTRNRCYATDGAYRPSKAQERTNGRRRRSRQVKRHGPELYAHIDVLLSGEQWSPEQIAGELARTGTARISAMTIYRYVQADVRAGGTLKRWLRHGRKRRRKRDVPPVLSSTPIWSPIPDSKEIGREEAVFRRADHRLPA